MDKDGSRPTRRKYREPVNSPSAQAEEAFRERFAALIKAARERAQMTRRKLADRIGKTPFDIKNYESALALPSVFRVMLIVRELGITTAELIDCLGDLPRLPDLPESPPAKPGARPKNFARDLEMFEASIQGMKHFELARRYNIGVPAVSHHLSYVARTLLRAVPEKGVPGEANLSAWSRRDHREFWMSLIAKAKCTEPG